MLWNCRCHNANNAYTRYILVIACKASIKPNKFIFRLVHQFPRYPMYIVLTRRSCAILIAECVYSNDVSHRSCRGESKQRIVFSTSVYTIPHHRIEFLTAFRLRHANNNKQKNGTEPFRVKQETGPDK